MILKGQMYLLDKTQGGRSKAVFTGIIPNFLGVNSEGYVGAEVTLSDFFDTSTGVAPGSYCSINLKPLVPSLWQTNQSLVGKSIPMYEGNHMIGFVTVYSIMHDEMPKYA